MGLKAKIEAIIYAAEEPITLEQISLLVKDIALAEESAGKAGAEEAAGPNADESAAVVTEAEAEAAPAETPAGSEPQPASVAAPEPIVDASVAPETAKAAGAGGSRKAANPEDARLRLRVRTVVEELIADYAGEDRGMEISQVAGGYRMATKPQHHDVVRAFARSLKPPVRLSLPALETLAVIAYKQPVTAPEISEIRGVESAGVLGTLLDRKLITTAGRKQVIGRPILYKTTKQFLLRFGLNELSELPSMEEFEKLALDGQVELFAAAPETNAPDEMGASASKEVSSEVAGATAGEEASPEEQSARQQGGHDAAPPDNTGENV